MNLEGDVLITDLEELGNDGRIGNLLKKTQCERGDISQRKRRIKGHLRCFRSPVWVTNGGRILWNVTVT